MAVTLTLATKLIMHLFHCHAGVCECVQAGGGVSVLAASWRHLAAGLSSGHAGMLDDRTGAAVAVWRAHDAAITAVAFSDAHHLLTASQVSTIRHAVVMQPIKVPFVSLPLVKCMEWSIVHGG